MAAGRDPDIATVTNYVGKFGVSKFINALKS